MGQTIKLLRAISLVHLWKMVFKSQQRNLGLPASILQQMGQMWKNLKSSTVKSLKNDLVN
jgi:hypothetical protein